MLCTLPNTQKRCNENGLRDVAAVDLEAERFGDELRADGISRHEWQRAHDGEHKEGA